MLFKILKSLLGGQNQFASGGLLLMIIGAVGVFLRELPLKLWFRLVEQTTMTITVNDEETAFAWIKEWFLEQEFLRRVRRVDLDTTLRGQKTALIPAPGRHWFWYAGRPFWVWFSRSEETKGWTSRRLESLTFRTVGRQQAFIKRFVDDVVACHRRKVSTASYLYVYEDGWTNVQSYIPRWLDSVILSPGEKEHLIADVQKFRTSWERYRHLGVPYHRGYLLHGPPGTGKTSLVSGMAAKFGMSIYALNLGELNDRTLKSAINDVPHNSVILFEDIDCMKTSNRGSDERDLRKSAAVGRNGKEDQSGQFGVTLSGLLNVLDGLYAPENVLYVMTSNHIDALDPALLRPGRIDYRLFLGRAADSQKTDLYRRFFPWSTETEAREFVRRHAFAETMAEFQGLLLELELESSEGEVASVGASHGIRE